MIPNYTTNNNYTPAEKFVAEKLIELVFTKTIDSYRVRLNNPFTALQEVKHVLTDWNAKKIKHFDKTIKPVIEEAARFLKDEKTILYKNIGEKYYSELLSRGSDKEYLQLYYATNVMLEDNKEYFSRLFDLTEAEIQKINGVAAFQIHELIHLDKLLEYLATQLVTHGYSKRYLYSSFARAFSQQSAKPFVDAFNDLKPLAVKPKEEYTVIFQLHKVGGAVKDVVLNSHYELTDEEKSAFASLNSKAEIYLTDSTNSTYFLRVNLAGRDFVSVIEDAKRELFTIVDLLHLGLPDKRFEFSFRCLVVGLSNPERATTQPISHPTDGNFKSHQDLYELLQQKLKRLEEKPLLEKESYRKVVSALRHLRLGTESDEAEQQFINYWIGLEYIFSNYDISDSTVARLKDYFTMAHANAYLHRNLAEFCQDIVRLRLSAHVPNFNLDLQFLKVEASFDHIIATYSADHPLLAFRAYNFKRTLHSKQTKESIKKHRTNLEWHLTRCYRVRNEIVHDAAIHLNIHSITANLRYYLIFILTDILNYLIDASNDINMTGSISLEDFFILEEIKYKTYEASGFEYNALLDENSPTELFS